MFPLFMRFPPSIPGFSEVIGGEGKRTGREISEFFPIVKACTSR